MTSRMEEVADFIADYALENNYLPTAEEIGRGLHMCTKNAWYYMGKLEKNGVIIRKGSRWVLKGLRYVRG